MIAARFFRFKAISLRRDPDPLYTDWIQVLDTTGDFRGMVNGFMNSLENRFHFGR